MDAQYIDDNQIIERYLAGSLSPDETESFEIHLLEHDEVLQELESTSVLRAGLRDIFAEDVTDSARKKHLFAGWFGHLDSPLRIAAAFVLVFGLATSGVLLLRDDSRPGADYESMMIELTAVRGGGSAEPVDHIVLRGNVPRMLQFPIPLHGAAARRVEVTLFSLDEPGPPIDSKEFKTDNIDSVVYSIVSSKLPASRYALRARTETGFLLANYSFRLIKTEH